MQTTEADFMQALGLLSNTVMILFLKRDMCRVEISLKAADVTFVEWPVAKNVIRLARLQSRILRLKFSNALLRFFQRLGERGVPGAGLAKSPGVAAGNPGPAADHRRDNQSDPA